MDFTDLEDLMDPEELIIEASEHLLVALATLDEMRRMLRGDAGLPRQERLNVALLARARKSGKRPRKRGAYPRRVE